MDELTRLYQQVIEHDDQDALLGLLRQADAERVGELFRHSVEEGNTKAMYYLAVVLTGEDPAGAERLLRRVVDEDPSNVKAMLHLAWMLGDRGGDPAEIQLLSRRAAESRDGAAYYDFAMILIGHKEMEAASDYIRKAVELGDHRARRKAEMIFRREIDGGETRTYNSLGVLLADRGEFDEAEECFRKAIDSGDVRAARNLANLFRERDRLG